MFLLLTVAERLLTSKRRSMMKRGSPMCCRCEEGILHALKDCEDVEGIWRALLPGNDAANFFSINSRNWFCDNLTGCKR